MKIEKKSALVKMQTDLRIGREKNLKKVKNLRKELSQIETVLKEKEILEKGSVNVSKLESKKTEAKKNI